MYRKYVCIPTYDFKKEAGVVKRILNFGWRSFRRKLILHERSNRRTEKNVRRLRIQFSAEKILASVQRES